jgi:SagB-type dehydrogenase family enzyme
MTAKTKPYIAILSLLAFVVGPAACNRGPSSSRSLVEDTAGTPLPPPALAGDISLEELLTRRRSVRSFREAPLTPAELGQLLWAAQGISDERGYRTAPSAGALYPLELYVATEEGIFHYLPQGHRWQVLSQSDARQDLYEAALRQETVRQAPAVFVLAAVYERTAQKYGGERSPRYVHLEAGHAGQNLLLEAVALGLGAVPIGAFDDGGVQEALALPADHQPLYLIPVGHPQ